MPRTQSTPPRVEDQADQAKPWPFKVRVLDKAGDDLAPDPGNAFMALEVDRDHAARIRTMPTSGREALAALLRHTVEGFLQIERTAEPAE